MTPDQLSLLHSMRAAGKGDDAIARALGVTRHAVRMEVQRVLEQKTAVPTILTQDDLFTLPSVPLQIDEYAARIAACWRKSVDSILMAGKLLKHAKDNLAHGEFLEMVERSLPFKRNTAERLMAIAKDERIANAAHAPILPTHWSTLYELTKLDNEQFEAKIADGTIRPDMERRDVATDIKRTARTHRERELGEKQAALPNARYGVIVADPEWRFEPWSRASGMDRAADNHYPTSVTEVIAARPVADIAADDCVLFLWATAPMLPHALLVMAAWGFDYRSNYVWAKDRWGTGYWNRNKHEHLLVGTRGKIPAPAIGTQRPSLIEAAVGEHSEKPECFLEMIEEYFPTLPKIELNRRGLARKGWAAWGNEALPGEYDSQSGELIEHAADIPIPDTVSASSEPACADPSAPQPPARAGSIDRSAA